MLRYLVPYLVVASLLVVAGGIAYGAGIIGPLGAYAAAFAATLVAGAGYVRWDRRRQPPRPRHG
jgi:hypothetical protein